MAAPKSGNGARPARIKDVAEMAGVSLKTVTNVVHERSNVKASTRDRVLAAIELDRAQEPNLPAFTAIEVLLEIGVRNPMEFDPVVTEPASFRAVHCARLLHFGESENAGVVVPHTVFSTDGVYEGYVVKAAIDRARRIGHAGGIPCAGVTA